MEYSQHSDIIGVDVHVPHSQSFTSASARLLTVGFLVKDIGKQAKDLDTGNYFVLTAWSPATQSSIAPDVPHASESVEGIIKFATQIEVNNGIDTTSAITPATLQTKINAIPAPSTATDSLEGLVELATSAEALTGTDTSKAVTPLGLESRIQALISGSPATLDTLNEIAAAFNDDPAFATNITNLIVSFHGQEIKSSDFTAVENTRYFIDTSGGIVNVTMPLSPTLSDFCEFHDLAGTFNTNAVNIIRNGENIMTLAQDSQLTTQYMSTKAVFSNATHGWRFVG